MGVCGAAGAAGARSASEMQSIKIPPIRLQKSKLRIAHTVRSDFFVAFPILESAIPPKIKGRMVQHPTIIPMIVKTLAAVFNLVIPFQKLKVPECAR